ncbi:MAG: quinate 5-dehydrogenase, partial [Sporomusaceae bacterium]|nr:quinate 5-dehydrogenase [Sporomusaceae bacterium]
VIPYLEREHNIVFKNKKVLLVSAVDRFGLAESLLAHGADIIFGDLLFGLGLPCPIKNFTYFTYLAKIVLPVLTKLPIKFFYPTGDKQNQIKPRFGQYFQEAQIIAGDFHFIKKNMPDNLKNKIIITNTVTPKDETLLQDRGVKTLVTTTPEMGGRSFGTNILEGILVAYAGRGRSLSQAEYNALLDEINIKPRVKQLF